MKLKWAARLRAGGTPPDEPANWTDEDCGIPWVAIGDFSASPGVASTARRVTEVGRRAKQLPIGAPGTVLFAMYASVGAISTLDISATWNQAILGVDPLPGRADGRFLAYWLESLRPRLPALFRSNTQDNLNAEQVGNLPFTRKRVGEQRAIADYLDAETARIDALITKKRCLIELLAHKIAATRERWLANLVDRFASRPLRRYLIALEQGWSPQCDGFSAEPGEWGVLKTSAVTSGRFRSTENKRLPEGVPLDARWIVADRDVLVARGSGSIKAVGQAAVAATDGRQLTISDLLYRVRTPGLDPWFLVEVLRAPCVRDMVEQSVRTDAGQTLKIRGDDLRALPIPGAPRDAQEEAVAELRSQVAQIEKLSRLIESQIDLLAEHRRALITAAVTGETSIAALA